MSKLAEEIVTYYEARGLVWPDTRDALAWCITELAEAYEVLLSRKNWVRNNPDDKPDWDAEAFCTELGDAVMMLVVAGWVNGRDVLDLLRTKMNGKLRKL